MSQKRERTYIPIRLGVEAFLVRLEEERQNGDTELREVLGEDIGSEKGNLRRIDGVTTHPGASPRDIFLLTPCAFVLDVPRRIVIVSDEKHATRSHLDSARISIGQ